jgi:nucleotide-binding universal stress UspA family protein
LYKKILVPLDGSPQAEGVLETVQKELLDTDGELILLRVVPMSRAWASASDAPLNGGQQPSHRACRKVASQARQEDRESLKAMRYLKGVASSRVWMNPIVRCRVMVADSLHMCIADFVRREDVDLIAFCEPASNGPSPTFGASVIQKIRRSVPSSVHVRVLRSQRWQRPYSDMSHRPIKLWALAEEMAKSIPCRNGAEV